MPIPCNVDQSTFFYHSVSNLSNPYYYAFSVSNTRYLFCTISTGDCLDCMAYLCTAQGP